MSLFALLHGENFWYFLVTSFLIGLTYWLYRLAYGTDIAKIQGIPEIPGSTPFYGHLKVLGNDHATAFEEIAAKNDWPVFQAKLGNRRIVVVNTFETAQEWMVKNSAATIDRPWFYTFHGLLSKTQGN
jgi:phenylacetate 2-hydroxylase